MQSTYCTRGALVTRGSSITQVTWIQSNQVHWLISVQHEQLNLTSSAVETVEAVETGWSSSTLGTLQSLPHKLLTADVRAWLIRRKPLLLGHR